MNNQSMAKLYVTHVDHIGPYLKIWGQPNRNAYKAVHDRIQTLLPTCFEVGETWTLDHQQALIVPGTFCIFKRKNNAAPDEYEFLRARVLNTVVNGSQREVPLSLNCEVELFDFGHHAHVSSRKLLFPKHPSLLNGISLCTNFIVLGICAEWNKSDLEQVTRLILNETVAINTRHEINNQKYITIIWKDFDLAEFLMEQKKIGASVDHKLQLDHAEKLIKDNPNIIPQVNKSLNNITNNNNYHYKNNNESSSNSQMGKTATDLAREQLTAQRSLSARLEKHRNPQIVGYAAPPAANSPKEYDNPSPAVVPVYAQRAPPTLGTLHSMVQGIRSQNNRIPMTGLNTQTNQHFNRPQLPMHNFGLRAVSNPMGMYYARYKQPQVPMSPAMPLLQYGPKPHLKPVVSSSPTFRPSFKSSNLVIGQTYDVTVSYVENGPYAFSVQLRYEANELSDMMNRLESVKLVPLNTAPYVSMACLARYSEDNQIYRALISGVYQTSCRVLYVDYGNSETVTYRDLYLIPHDYLEDKPYSMRFMLSGSKQLEPIDDNLKKAFKDYILYGNFKLTVMPLEGPPLVQYCQLMHDGVNIINMLREIKQTRLIYPDAEPLKNEDMVEIRYIDSPRHFYVQKQKNILDFEKLMDEMFVYYNTNQVVPNELTLGSPCIVKFDNEWYRAEIMRSDAQATIVRHVDFGYEQRVTKNLLSTIAEKHIKMPRQAVQCCLKGFENNELKKSVATDQFEMLAEESNLGQRRLFSVRVFRIQPDGANIVNLISKNLNVMKKLYKLCMPFEQYLSLEKEEFNTNSINLNSSVNRSKTPSIASSNEGGSQQSSKKVILNSTSLQSDERFQQQNEQQQQLQQQQKPQKQQRSNNNNKNDWDKVSSMSSPRDNRDSRSLSSDQQSQQSGGRNQQQQEQNRSSGRSSQWDNQSNGSVGSSLSAGSKHKRRNGEVPPRFQNGKQEAINNSRFNKNQSPRKQQQEQQQQQQQQRNQRPQNAPQGYSQKPQRQKSTLNGASLSKKSSSSEISSISSDVQQKPQPEVYVPLEHAFPLEDIKLPANEEISICWWISPFQFYIQRKSKLSKYDQMLREMQTFYKQKPHQQLQLKVGSSVVARYRKDNIIQRARILACNHMLRKYKVYFVDMGNQYTVTSEDIWQVEKRFANMACMAYRCGFDGIVSNYDHLYIVDRMDKHLPQGATIKCEFVRRYKEAYNVNVLVNGVPLKETLKNVGFVTEVAKETRVDLLAGQQIRAKITSIKDMLNFKIQLEGFDEKVHFLCSFDDLRYVKSNSDVAKKFKQFYEGKSYILNIKDVNDNNVILLRPMMPLFKDDIPSNICTYPVLLEYFQARVVFTESLHRLYVQPLALIPKIKTLLMQMNQFYQRGGKAFTKFEQDQFCAANGKDGNWYRARLISSANPNEKVIKVFYVDYGQTEDLERKHIKVLEEQFYLNTSALAVELNLPFGRVLNEAQAKLEADGLLKQEVIVKPIEARRNHVIADIKLKSNSQCLIELFKSKQLIKSRDVDQVRKHLDREKSNKLEYIETVDLTLEDEDDDKKNKKSATSSPKRKKQVKDKAPSVAADAVEVPPVEKVTKTVEPPIESSASSTATEPEAVKPAAVPKISEPAIVSKPEPPIVAVSPQPVKPPTPVDPYAHMETAVLSHCDNPAQFYVHPQDTLDQLHKLQENLQIVSPQLPQLSKVVNGAECISLYSVDKQWYRAKILDAELMVLQFIDFGNTDCVSDTTDVKESMWTHVAPYCLPCALPIRPKGTADWVDAANAFFNDSYNKVLHYEYITHGDHQTRSYIDLHIEGINVANKLIDDGYAIPLEVVKSGENCFLSHVNSISDFYIQFEKDSKALELIEFYLNDDTEKRQPIKQFEKSQIVVALFNEDDLWYRAELLREVPGEGYEVRFIDYGNTSISSECRVLTEDLAKLPALSKKCELELPADRIAWSDEAEQKFGEIAATGETIFTVTLRQPAAGRVIVHLSIDDHNINDDLAPLCAQREEKVAAGSNVSSQNTSLQLSSHHENGCQLAAIVSNVNTPLDFYVQFEKDSARVEHITETLNSIALEGFLKDVDVGQLCAARFVEDDALYRACILEVMPAATSDDDEAPKQYRVQFIDFGNESTASELYELPQDLLELKALATQCRLESSPKFTQIPVVSNETFNALLEGCACLVNLEYVDVDSKPALVKLFTNDNKAMNICKQLHQLLDSAKTTPAPAPASKATTQCVISHANSPDSFYIQLKKHSAELDLVAKTLEKTKVAELPLMKNVMEDLVVICYSQEDDCYYRGMVKTILENDEGYEVFLVDVGSVTTTKELRQMPKEICSLPCLAVHCTLSAMPTDVDNAKLVEAFSTLLEAHFGEVFEVVKSEPDKKTLKQKVQLEIDYKDLAKELAKAVAGIESSPMPTLYDCTVVQFNSPTSFYLQLHQDIPALESITYKLLDAEELFPAFEQFQVGEICAAQFPDDEAFYRAELMQKVDSDKWEVFFIDFGNTSVTDKFRALPPDLRSLQRYCKHCQLDSVAIAKCDASELQAFIDARYSETFQAELLTTAEPCVTRLFHQGKNLADGVRQGLQDTKPSSCSITSLDVSK